MQDNPDGTSREFKKNLQGSIRFFISDEGIDPEEFAITRAFVYIPVFNFNDKHSTNTHQKIEHSNRVSNNPLIRFPFYTGR
jgi:hypothetical protein